MGEIELESPTERPAAPPAAPMHRGVLAGLGLAVVALVAVVLIAEPDDTPRSVPGTEVSTTLPPETQAAATTDEAISTTTIEPVVGSVRAGPLLLGEPTELVLWAGGDAPVSRIDLDSGEVLELEQRAYPLFAQGRWLVLFEPRLDEYVTIDRTDPALRLERLELRGTEPVHAVGPGPSDDTVWMAYEEAPAGFRWLLISLRTRAPLQSLTTETLHASPFPQRVLVTPGPLVDQRGAELWRFDTTTHVRWIEGTLVAFGPELALVEQCDPECRHRWFDHTTGEESPVDVPPPQSVLERVEVLAGGEWMHMRTESASTSLLVETFTSRTLDTGLRVPQRIFDVSPDGRWAAMPGFNLMRITDLRTGDVTPLPNDVSTVIGNSASVVLTPRLG